MSNYQYNNITNNMSYEQAIAKFCGGAVYRQYQNIARYIWLMYKYDKSIKQVKKDVRKYAKSQDLNILNSTLQNESKVADILLNCSNRDASDAIEQAQFDIALVYIDNLQAILQGASLNEQGATAQQIIARLESYLQDNKLNYRNVIQQPKKDTQAEQADASDGDGDEQADASDGDGAKLTLAQIVEAIQYLNIDEVKNLALHVNAILTNTLDEQGASRRKAQASQAVAM